MGSSNPHNFNSCIKFELLLSPSPRNGSPCWARKATLESIFNKHCLLPFLSLTWFVDTIPPTSGYEAGIHIYNQLQHSFVNCWGLVFPERNGSIFPVLKAYVSESVVSSALFHPFVLHHHYTDMTKNNIVCWAVVQPRSCCKPISSLRSLHILFLTEFMLRKLKSCWRMCCLFKDVSQSKF